MPTFDMYCNHEECGQYQHSETFLLKSPNQKVSCGECGNPLEKKISGFNIGGNWDNKGGDSFIEEIMSLPVEQIDCPCGYSGPAINLGKLNRPRKNKFAQGLN